MMITNIDYTSIVEKARASGSTSVNFDTAVQPISSIKAEQDTVTISQQAIALMNGNSTNVNTEETAPTYVRPETASSLLAQNNTSTTEVEKSEKDIRFDEIMQNILDQRTGVDRKKLDEINAMIEEVANNENLSPEEKEKMISMLEEMKEELMKETIELQKVAKQTDTDKEDV